MTKINFVIGLTDVEDYDGFVYENNEVRNPDVIRAGYNIKKASTDIEKASITWSLDTNLDVTKNMIKVWEHIIRRPHLNMIGVTTIKNPLATDYNHYNLEVSFINLIPMLPDYKILLTADDLSNIVETNDFGDMVLDLTHINGESGINHLYTVGHAFHNDTTDLLKEYQYPYTLPIFSFDFRIMHRPIDSTPRGRHSNHFIDWVNENKDALAAKGYTLDDPYCNIGVLRIGKLIGDPWDEYQKLQKYSRICRTSIVTVEE
jgi:hypothetical protein